MTKELAKVGKRSKKNAAAKSTLAFDEILALTAPPNKKGRKPKKSQNLEFLYSEELGEMEREDP